MKKPKFQHPSSSKKPNVKHAGGARHSVRAADSQTQNGAHGVPRPTFTPALASRMFGVSLVLGVWCLLLLPLHAQTNYTIDWFTVDGGGGTSTGGVYSVSGTIGQPDADGPMTNSQYSVTGGFWALPVAVQNTNAPTLTIVSTGAGQAIVSWTPNAPGFVLQETVGLSPANWIDSVSGATNPVVVPAALPTKFYRLRKP